MKRTVKCIQTYWEDVTEYWTEGNTYRATKHRDGTWSIETNVGNIGGVGKGYMLDDFDEYFKECK